MLAFITGILSVRTRQPHWSHHAPRALAFVLHGSLPNNSVPLNERGISSRRLPLCRRLIGQLPEAVMATGAILLGQAAV